MATPECNSNCIAIRAGALFLHSLFPYSPALPLSFCVLIRSAWQRRQVQSLTTAVCTLSRLRALSSLSRSPMCAHSSGSSSRQRLDFASCASSLRSVHVNSSTSVDALRKSPVQAANNKLNVILCKLRKTAALFDIANVKSTLSLSSCVSKLNCSTLFLFFSRASSVCV